MIRLLINGPVPFGVTRGAVNLSLINLQNALFSTSCVILRKYEVWTNLAKRHGFAPAEVIEASALGAYVVVDPMNKSSLLALSPMAYQKLLGQTMSTENLSLILLLSPLDELERSAAEASPEATKSPPLKGFVNKISLDLERLKERIQTGRLTKGVRWPSWSLGYPFQGYQGLGCRLSDGRLILSRPSEFSAIFQRWASRLHFWSGSSRGRRFRSSLWVVTNHLQTVLKHSGPYGLALYLKASYNIVLRYVAGQPFEHAFTQCGVPVQLQNGLPKFLPREWRVAIRSGSPRLLRIVLSLLYSYKGFKATKPKPVAEIFKNISLAAHQPDDIIAFSKFCFEFLKNRISPISEGELNPPSLPASLKAGPNGPLSALAYGADAYAWIQRESAPYQPSVPGPLEWVQHFGLDKWEKKFRAYSDWFLKRGFNHQFNVTFPPPTRKGFGVLKLKIALGLNVPESKSIALNPKFAFHRRTVSYTPTRVEDVEALQCLGLLLPVGRVHVLWEAAGKTRVIAMMDGLRQALLRPVHLAMFRRIDKIFGFCSGLYDQSGAVRSFAALNNREVFSYDISAATDTIPYQLYFPLMEFLLGKTGAVLWNHMVRGHPFIHLEGGDEPWAQRLAGSSSYYYERGQPMGGYSSFAALDMLHHLIVQYSAFEAGYDTLNKTFDNYRILGDDVVIGDVRVAKTYLNFMRTWNIPISENKSLVSSKGVFQFLSEVFRGGECLSPLSFRADYQSKTFLERFSFAATAVSRGWSSGLAMEGFGRLILSKDQFLSEIHRYRNRRPSAFIYSLLFALVTFAGEAGWALGSWLHNVVAHDPFPQLLSNKELESVESKNFVFTILRQILFTEAGRIHELQKAESGVNQTRQFLDFGSIEFHNDIENDVDSLWLLAREGKTLLESADVTPDWVTSAFSYLRKVSGIIPRLSATGVVHPLDYLVLMKTTEDRNNIHKVNQWSPTNHDAEEIFRVRMVDTTFSLIKSNPYYHEVLTGISSPYGLALRPVPEEGRPSGSS
ncbi:RNA-dependent RNA polymerase [Gigaspora margarita mitovirus 3]|uniref:RNA-dependent RNA polymerase n=1 Tax=Gigaspora margarita mitovirus 3 TaxID=2082667 RepID=A0A2L0VZH5_9VIRU|nr:RNA-dependent RNA polymerase [Gigaspora margarita mitovirus 3]AVA17451.1 RNA-dependent RNA polymerase [Gigaspora margarita mitovirus 3]